MANEYLDRKDEYYRPREEGDIDLVAVVRNNLIAAGLGSRVALYYDTHYLIRDAETKRPEIQRFLLNRYWLLQLANCSHNTQDQRFALIDKGDVAEWLQLFNQAILPFLSSFELPGDLTQVVP